MVVDIDSFIYLVVLNLSTLGVSLDRSPTVPENAYRSRNPWLAALATLWIPGLGHLYVGKPARATCLVATFVLAYVLLLSTYRYSLNFTSAVLFIGCLLICLGGIVDAWRQATRQINYSLKSYNRWWVYVAFILTIEIVLFGSAPRTAIAFMKTTHNFHIQSASMAPTLIVGDYLITDIYPPRLAEIKNGDVILFMRDGVVFVKRVVGMPGDQVSMTDGILSINGQPRPHQSDVTLQEARITSEELKDASIYREVWPDGHNVNILQKIPATPYDSFSTMTVPADSVFVLGDSRDNSNDSRNFGVIPRSQIIGRASFILWSRHFNRIGRSIN